MSERRPLTRTLALGLWCKAHTQRTAAKIRIFSESPISRSRRLYQRPLWYQVASLFCFRYCYVLRPDCCIVSEHGALFGINLVWSVCTSSVMTCLTLFPNTFVNSLTLQLSRAIWLAVRWFFCLRYYYNVGHVTWVWEGVGLWDFIEEGTELRGQSFSMAFAPLGWDAIWARWASNWHVNDSIAYLLLCHTAL